MDLNSVLLVVVIILQIVTIKKQGGVSNKPQTRPAGAPVGANKGEPNKGTGPHRADNNNRKPGGNANGKPHQQGNRPQQHNQQSAAMPPMEKTLRDLNLQLKNVEREQESARKKIGDSPSGPPPRDNRPQQSPHRGGNSGGGFRNDGFRNDRGGNPPPPRREIRRDNRPPEQQQHRENAAPPQARPEFAERPFQAERPAAPVNIAQQPEIISDIPNGDMQHGRRFTAKRRPLPENAAEAQEPEAIRNINNEGAPMPDTFNAPPPVADIEASDLSFGRGRR